MNSYDPYVPQQSLFTFIPNSAWCPRCGLWTRLTIEWTSHKLMTYYCDRCRVMIDYSGAGTGVTRYTCLSPSDDIYVSRLLRRVDE